MKVFFDCEFTGLHQNTTLISIGMIDENDYTFYAEFGDYNHHQVNDWIRNNVLNRLTFHDPTFSKNKGKGWCNSGTNVLGQTEAYGNTEFNKLVLKDWLSKYDEVEMWSDCLSYDWVLFNSLFGTAFDIPDNVYYIPFDICTLFKVYGIDPDISREHFAQIDIYNIDKHNALFDAKVIKKCYEQIVNS